MRSNKQQNNVSPKSAYNKMDQQGTQRGSRVDKDNYRASNSATNKENDILQPRMSRERSRQDLLAADTYTQKANESDGAVSEAALETIQKCMDHTLRAYFIHTMEKIECLSGQLLRNECAFSKMHLDLVERICKLCNQNVTQYQTLVERIGNRLGNELLEDLCDNGFSCNCDSDCELLATGVNENHLEQYDEPTTEELVAVQKPQYSDNERCFECEEKIKSLNLELKSTKEELENCLQRLKEINEIQRKMPNATVLSNDRNIARGSQVQHEKKCCCSTCCDCITKQLDIEEACATKEDIPQPPPEPVTEVEAIPEEKPQRESEIRTDYDSEPANSFYKRQSNNHSERKSLPKSFERPQNYTNQRLEKKGSRKS